MQLYLLSVKTSLWMVSPPSSGELCLVELALCQQKGRAAKPDTSFILADLRPYSQSWS